MKIYEFTNHNIMIVGKFITIKYGIKDTFSLSERVIDNFYRILESAYKENPYHNANHGADVCASMFYFVCNSDLVKFMSKLDVLAVLIASLGHDVGHPGVTNRYLVNNRDRIALRFNDQSVLENMHIYTIFKIM